MSIQEVAVEPGEIGTLLVNEIFPHHVVQPNLAHR